MEGLVAADPALFLFLLCLLSYASLLSLFLFLEIHHQNPNAAIANAIPPTIAGIATAIGKGLALAAVVADEVGAFEAMTEMVTTESRSSISINGNVTVEVGSRPSWGGLVIVVGGGMSELGI